MVATPPPPPIRSHTLPLASRCFRMLPDNQCSQAFLDAPKRSLAIDTSPDPHTARVLPPPLFVQHLAVLYIVRS